MDPVGWTRYAPPESPEERARHVAAIRADAHASGTGEVPVGDVNHPTWWLWWGTCRPSDHTKAWLSDDTDIDVLRLGGLWAAEFIRWPTTLFVQIGDTTLNCVQRRPHYLPAPAHPIQPATTNPRG